MITERINDITLKIFNIDNPDDFIMGKQEVEKYLIDNKFINEETTIEVFLRDIINISKCIFIENLFSDDSESIAFGIEKFDDYYMFVTDINSAYETLMKHFHKINFDMSKLKYYDVNDVQNLKPYLLSINSVNYYFDDDL